MKVNLGKENSGVARVEGVWVFGALERETGRVFMENVEKRDAQTLIPLLEKWVLPKTNVISDCWKAYNNMQNFYHLKVNHSINFVDEPTGAHTNAIESSWRHAKESFSSHGRKEHVPGNLARYMFQKSCCANNTDLTEAFLIAGRVYNPATNEAHDFRDADGELDRDVELFDIM